MDRNIVEDINNSSDLEYLNMLKESVEMSIVDTNKDVSDGIKELYEKSSGLSYDKFKENRLLEVNTLLKIINNRIGFVEILNSVDDLKNKSK